MLKNKFLLIIKLLQYLIYGTIHTVLLIRYYSYGIIVLIIHILTFLLTNNFKN